MRIRVIANCEILGLVAASLLFASCSGTNATASSSLRRDVTTTSVSKSTIQPAGFIAEMFVATSAEYNSPPPQRWHDFIYQARNHVAYNCMIGDGYSSSQTKFLLEDTYPQNSSADNTQFPNVARLKSGDLGLGNWVKDATTEIGPPSMPSSERKAFDADMEKCLDEPVNGVGTILRELHPIFGLWGRDMAAVSVATPVVRATKSWSICVAAGGVPATTPTNYFLNLDQYVRTNEPGAKDPYSAPGVVSRVKLYGNCVGPLANAMDEVREADLRQLENRYGSELVTIARQMNSAIAAISAKYGLQNT